jgi:NAD(P)H-dependent FMN reductase
MARSTEPAAGVRGVAAPRDGVRRSSPEYNGSMPGALKNLIDWTSRFRPQPFDERHGLLVSASPSLAGGNRGLWALRVPFEHLGARIYPDMFSLAMAHKAFAGDKLADAAPSSWASLRVPVRIVSIPQWRNTRSPCSACVV